MKKQWIYGKHAIDAALKNKKRDVFELWVSNKHQDNYQPYYQDIIKITTTADLNKRFPSKVHQGVAALVGPLPELSLHDILEKSSLLLVLDQITDPHNLGACLRSANAFGADAVIIPAHGSVSLTDTAVKASASASEHTPLITVPNLNKTLEILKKENFWTVGLDGNATQELSKIDLSGKIAIVMGSEGKGLRDLVSKNCDFTAKLPMCGQVESLNVSVATGISLYEVLRQKQ